MTLASPPNSMYSADGPPSLIDGELGSDDYYDPKWMGYWYEDGPFEAVVDLGAPTAVETLGLQKLIARYALCLKPFRYEKIMFVASLMQYLSSSPHVASSGHFPSRPHLTLAQIPSTQMWRFPGQSRFVSQAGRSWHWPPRLHR